MAPGLLLALCAAAWGSSQAATVEGIYVAGFSTSDEGSMTHMIDYTRGRLRFESGLAKGHGFVIDTPAASNAPAAKAADNIVCYVDEATGTVLNLRQGTTAACRAGGLATTLPTAGKFVTGVALAVDKSLPLVGRLTLYTKDRLDGPAVAHTCGWAGGDGVELVPDGVVVRGLSVGCQPLTPLGPNRHGLVLTNAVAVNPEQVRAVGVLRGGLATQPPPPSLTLAPTGVVEVPSFSVPMSLLSSETLEALAVMARARDPCANKRCTSLAGRKET